ncbi:MAG: hypothetical protein OXL96_28580 [Candidatus Poribacteria bacterium]|nr:hypothetical protein [Candidatus Poribacteria bacterium]
MSDNDKQAGSSDDLELGNIGRAIADDVVIEYLLEVLGTPTPLNILQAKMEEFTIGSKETILDHLDKSPRFPGDSELYHLTINDDFVKRVRYWKRRMK